MHCAYQICASGVFFVFVLSYMRKFDRTHKHMHTQLKPYERFHRQIIIERMKFLFHLF